MKLIQIEYFLAVCQYGSISMAADKLLVSRPAISRTIKEIEDEFGVSLFKRSTVGVHLTEAGQVFFDRCTEIQHQLAEMQSEMEAIRNGTADENDRIINVGLSFTARCSMLPFLGSFSKEYPRMHMHISDTNAAFLDTMSFNRDFDVIISLCNEQMPEGLEYIDLEESYLAFCCSRSHPLAQRESVSIFEIKDEPLIGLSGLDPKKNQMVSLYTRFGLKPNIVSTTQQMSAMRHTIHENLCSTIKPYQTMEEDPDIATVRIEESPKIMLRIVWERDVSHNSAVSGFLEYAKKEFE